jgi:hypothetical protein
MADLFTLVTLVEKLNKNKTNQRVMQFKVSCNSKCHAIQSVFVIFFVFL